MSLQSSSANPNNSPLGATTLPADANEATSRSRYGDMARLAFLLGRVLLAGLFLWAGVRKAMDPELFLQDIESYEILPHRWAWLMSIWLPFLEITAVVALVMTRKWAQAGALVLGGLLVVFLAAIISAWARGLTLSCGCFGASSEPSNYPWLVTRDLLLLGLAVYVYVKSTTASVKSAAPASDEARA